MLLTIQIIGIIFGVGMLYLTYIYLKRREFSVGDTVFWLIVWGGFVLLIIFSSSANIILESLRIHRAMDLFMMLGFLIMSIVIFHLYATSRRLSKKIEILVRKMVHSKTKTHK